MKILIMGLPGSGKTTLIKLLEGLYHPNKGRVLVDGHDIRHVSPHSLRTQLGVVPQECFLFSGTILENITLYRHEFTLEQAVEAAKLAEAEAAANPAEEETTEEVAADDATTEGADAPAEASAE